MKILFVISSLGIGGEQRALSNITSFLVENNHIVEVLTFKKNEKRIKLNKRIKTFVISEGILFRNIRRLFEISKYAKKGGFDIVIGFAVIPSILVSLGRLFHRRKVVVCERNDPTIYSFKIRLIRRFAYLFADGAVFQTLEASECFPWLKSAKKIIIPNPIDDVVMENIIDFDKRENIIINTSRHTIEKNQLILLMSIYNLKKLNRLNGYSVELYGEGPTTENLQEYIKKNDLDDVVQIHQPKAEIISVLAKRKVFVLTSNHEGFPNSLLESMSLGLVCISTNCRIGGPKEMISDEYNGFLFEVNHVNELTKKLDFILNSNQLCTVSKNSIDSTKKYQSSVISNIWESYINDI